MPSRSPANPTPASSPKSAHLDDTDALSISANSDATGAEEPAIFRFMRRVGPPNDAKWKSEDEQREGGIYCSIMMLNSVMERLGNRTLEAHGLTLPQWMALGAALGAGEAGVSHSELGARMMLSKAPVTGIVDRLERAGWVERHRDQSDRRVSRVVITPAGAELWQRAHEALIEGDEFDMNAALSPADQDLLLQLLGRLLEAFAASDPVVADLCARPQESSS